MSLWAKPPGKTLMHVYPLESRLLRPDSDFQTPSPPPPLSKHSNKKSVSENAMLLAATNIQGSYGDLNPPNVIRLSKTIFLLLKQNTFLLPQPSFFILTHLGCSGNHTTLLISLLFYIVFFYHATLDISALSITHTHIIIIIIIF